MPDFFLINTERILSYLNRRIFFKLALEEEIPTVVRLNALVDEEKNLICRLGEHFSAYDSDICEILEKKLTNTKKIKSLSEQLEAIQKEMQIQVNTIYEILRKQYVYESEILSNMRELSSRHLLGHE